MYIIAEQRFIIERPVEDVFGFMANLENFGKWFPGVIAIVAENDLPVGVVGKQYLETVRIPVKGYQKVRIQVVEAVANECLVTEGKLPPLMPRMDMRFTRQDAGTSHVHWRMYSRSTHPLFKMIGVPLVKALMGKRAKQGARNVQRLLNTPSI